MAALYRRLTDTCLPIFKCSQAEKATRQRRSLSQLKNAAIDAPSSSLAALIATLYSRVDANRSTLPMANKYLFADL